MDTSHANPVLSAFREHAAKVRSEDIPNLAQEWLDHFPYYWHNTRNGRIALVRHRAFAKRVFAKLASLRTSDPLPWVHRINGERSATGFNGMCEWSPRG